MAYRHRIVEPGLKQGTLCSRSGEELVPPRDWAFLKAGDAAITRSVKAKGESWVVQVRRGRRMTSKGIWANKGHIESSEREVAAKRNTPEYQRRRAGDLARREAKQRQYLVDFCASVVGYLGFDPRYHSDALSLGQKITEHAAPVGSGTVARTERIPLAKRAEAATIAWLRHQTTSYDAMRIARVKGKRREIRRQLAAKSIKLLQAYRQGRELAENCPLQKALRADTTK